MYPSARFTVCIALILFAVPALKSPAWAAPPPDVISFQGRLIDSSGSPVNTDVSMVFTLYDAESGGTAVWTESRPVVAVNSGLYQVHLGEGTPLDPADFAQALWLGVSVNGDPEMTPRYRLVPGAYALRAASATTADSATTAGSAASFSGSLSGDVTGTQGATVVSKLQGLTLAIGTPAAGHVLKWNGSAWAPAADADTTYGAGDGLSLSGTTFSASYAGSGGDLGSALSLARSDHVHDSRYYTEAEIDTALAGKVSKAGDTMTGALSITAPGDALLVTHNVVAGGSLAVAGSGAFTGTVSGADPTAANHFVTMNYADANYIRSGTFVTSTTAVLDFPQVSNNDTSDLEMDVPNVQPGDSVALGIPASVMPQGVFVIAFVSGVGKVKVRYGVIGIGGGYNPSPATFRVTVFRYQ